MFCVIYEFTVKPGLETEFQDAWHGLTMMIREHQGSLGSRLHRGAGHKFIAYAQWPSREQWKSPPPLPPVADELRNRMRESCDKIQVLHELEVVDDLLAKPV